MAADESSDPRILSNILFKDKVYFDKFTSETDGEVTRANITVAAGGGNPLHYHGTFVETFECIKGTLGLEIGYGNTIHLDPGQRKSAPKNTVHRFFNDTKESVDFRVMIEPGSEGFEKSLYIVYGLANDGLTDGEGFPKNFLHMSTFVRLGDINIAGWKGWLLNPLIRAGYAYARWSGVERQLIEKYWRADPRKR